MEESIVASGLTGKCDVNNVEAPTNPKSKHLVLFFRAMAQWRAIKSIDDFPFEKITFCTFPSDPT